MNREDLSDIIAIVARDEAPLYSSSQKVKSTGVYHEWQTDSLSTGSDNAAIEGADFNFSLPTARTRVGNWTQIFTKTLEVSETQQAVSVAGVDDEYAYLMEKRMKEIATDIEKALITGTGNSGASGTGRRLKGALAFIATNIASGSATGVALTETIYNNALQTVWAAGGRPDTTYVNGFQKRKISGFSSNSQRFQTVAEGATLANSVSVYESDFGRQKIVLNPFMDTDKLLIVQSDLVKVATLRGIRPVDVATVGDAKRGALVGELTLQVGNELGLGKVVSLATA